MCLWDLLQPQAVYHITHTSISIANLQLCLLMSMTSQTSFAPSLLAGCLLVSSLVDNVIPAINDTMTLEG